MSATERLLNEQTFHDAQAKERAATFQRDPDRLRFTDDDYLDHETWIRPAFAQLGDVHTLDVLDYGCGHGMAAVVLARRGARVRAFDLSAGYLAEVRRRAAANGVEVGLTQADGERLPFADGVFDRIWGNAVLHHLDMDKASAEIHRVLRPGGRAIFCEPWGGNPLLSLARRRIHYSGKGRTIDEQPLLPKHLHTLRAHFPRVEVEGYQLLSMASRLLPRGRWLAGLERCDRALLSRLPRLSHFCRYFVLTLSR